MKPFKTLDEQLAILEARGLVFSDKENAKKKLSFYGYYEIINGYKDFLLEKKQKITDHQEECFIENSTFDHIFSLFMMDKTITSSVIDATCDVEMYVRAAISYVVSKNIGEQQIDYLNRRHYQTGKKNKNGQGYKVDQLITKFKKIIYDDIEPMKHYRGYHGNVPPWIMLKGTTFGNLANFYKLQKSENKKEVIAMILGIPKEIVDEGITNMFTDIIFLCHSYRNRAAHGGRMYNYRSAKAVIRYSENFHHRANITQAEYRKGKGISCLGTLFHALTWMDNKVALARLQAGVSVALDQHLKVYPKDYDLVLSESNINPKFLQLSR